MRNRKEITIWGAESQIIRKIHDVRISFFKNAKGPPRLKFHQHSIAIVDRKFSTSSGFSDDKQFETIYPRHTVCFAPKSAEIVTMPAGIFNLTVLEIPDHWFDQALSRLSAKSSTELERFETQDDFTLLYGALLLETLAVRPQLQDSSQLSDLLIGSVAERVLLHNMLGDADRTMTRTGNFSTERMEAIAKYVDAHIAEPIRLVDMAGVIGLSPFHFSREFRIAKGATPMRYVLERRVHLAKTLLKDRNLSLAAIALNCGFSSQSHFTTSFRSVTGFTPARYRAG